ncbi:MAG TPA: hypothetical protein VLA35_09815 [Thermoleophilia bacterium]|nr:hypothetical protein [Thermoleophilia bacterium]
MTIDEAAQYVAAAYAVILVVLIVYFAVTSRRVSALRRDVELLRNEVEKRERRGEGA